MGAVRMDALSHGKQTYLGSGTKNDFTRQLLAAWAPASISAGDMKTVGTAARGQRFDSTAT